MKISSTSKRLHQRPLELRPEFFCVWPNARASDRRRRRRLKRSVPSKEEEEKKWRVPSSGDFGAPKSDWRAPKSIPAECGRGVSDKRPQRNTFCPFENVSTCRHFDAIRSPPATRNRHRHVIYGLRVLARWLALWSSPPGGTCGVWNVKCPSIHQVHPPGVHFSRINK